MINILLITANSITYEIVNKDCYYTAKYDLYLNDNYYDSYDKNVISIYNLNPNTKYKLKINDDEIEFTTLNKKLIYPKDNNLQNYIDNLNEDETLVIDRLYNVVALFMKSNTSIYITKDGCLLGETDRTKFPILKADEYLNDKPLGTWEGRADDSFASIITFLGVSNVVIYGQGTIDCNAQNSDWWIDHRTKRIARRPKGIFMHTSNNITLEGVKVCNTPSWNQHPFYSNNINYYNMRLENPYKSPTTDGCDPESCDGVNIIGNFFSVGDDCIAIKSGKIELASIYKTPSTNIMIRNNLMNHGHAGVTLGSENSGGINNVTVTNCIFRDTDRGLRIKSQRGRGNIAIIKDITFDNIYMNNVMSPFVINAFYKAGNDVADYRFDYRYREPDELTPVFKSFEFKNIKCENVSYGLAYIVGLPESKIESVLFENISVTYNRDCEPGEMAMSLVNNKYKNIGFRCENVGTLKINNVKFIDSPTEMYILDNVNNVIEKK